MIKMAQESRDKKAIIAKNDELLSGIVEECKAILNVIEEAN
ncbi:hypothetical protein NDS46_30445 (plasmid) [Paenibacillus thiaminolyticus]|nr:hypothetical protein [Paenibacillus thiaminolyticus]WCF11669.1 hypothetical protein NDS46_30445 [Paenibacillus thiaminolyticus]